MLSSLSPVGLSVSLFALMLVLCSCEKENFSNQQSNTNEPTLSLHQAIPDVPLTELQVTVQNSRLVFPDLIEFAKAKNAIAKAGRSEVAEWQEKLQFQSMYLSYVSWSNALPEDETALTVAVPQFAYREGKGREVSYLLNSYSLVTADLANAEGEFLIGKELHKVTLNRHIHIPSGSTSLLPVNPDDAESDTLAGVFVRTYDPLYSESSSPPDAKDIDKDMRVCPIDHSNTPGNQLRLEAMDDNNGYRMYGGIVMTSVDTKSGSNVTSIAFTAEAYLRNQRKSGFIWKADYVSSTNSNPINWQLIRRPLGELTPNSCAGCPDDQWTVFDDGPADRVGYSVSPTNNPEYNTVIFDSGTYYSSTLRTQPQGTFVLKDLRYDVLRGIGKFQRTVSPILDVEVGCSN